MFNLNAKTSMAAGIAAAIGASLCCVGPLALLALGVGGAWIGSLTKLEPYRPYFIVLMMASLSLAYCQLYRVPVVCAPDATCADPKTMTRQRVIFWIVSAMVLALIAVPWIAPLFL